MTMQLRKKKVFKCLMKCVLKPLFLHDFFFKISEHVDLIPLNHI